MSDSTIPEHLIQQRGNIARMFGLLAEQRATAAQISEELNALEKLQSTPPQDPTPTSE